MDRTGQGHVCHSYTKIVGVTHRNPNGSDRQILIQKCSLLDRLDLDHEQDNPHDPNAVRVLRGTGEQLGYLQAEVAADIVSKSERGYRFEVFITDISGDEQNGQSLGVKLLVIQADPGIEDGPVKNYLKQLIATDPELEWANTESMGPGCLIALALIVASWVIIGFLLWRK